MGSFKTEQERFWAGDFGTEYSARNVGPNWVASNTALFAKVLARTENVGSVLELGANIGLNLMAIRNLRPEASLAAVEINETAATELRKIQGLDVHVGSLIGFQPPRPFDLVLIKGVLIHINPDALPEVYETLYRSSGRYICLAEYYNPSPTAIPYRGHGDKLFKRDFAGDLLDRYGDKLRLVDYGFQYRRDRNFPQDDLTWFLLEKAS